MNYPRTENNFTISLKHSDILENVGMLLVGVALAVFNKGSFKIFG